MDGGSDGEEHFSSDDDASFDGEEEFRRDLPRARNNDPKASVLEGNGHYDIIQNMNDEQWEGLGRDISNNTHLVKLELCGGALNDEKMSYLFRGLTRSSSITYLDLQDNELSIAGVKSMVPFLQHSNNLRTLVLGENNIQSEGFRNLLQTLRDGPIEHLYCDRCSIESIEIDIDHFPRKLKTLWLDDNNINAGGCREIAKLLLRGDAALKSLNLNGNNIDDEGVAILVEALRSNTSLEGIQLRSNRAISNEGLVMVLKLVNDISSIKATLQSNHSLKTIGAIDAINYFSLEEYRGLGEDKEIQRQIDVVTNINRIHSSNPEAAGREKVIGTLLRSETRAELAELQGVSHSVYSEINPLHLPEVLSLVGRRHGRGELFLALKSSIAGVISVVNERQCIAQQLAYHEAKVAEHASKSAELRSKLEQLDAAGRGRDAMHIENVAYNSNKRARNW